MDAPGPWATGPFTLAEGFSSVDAEQAVTQRDPFACTWLLREDRTPRVRLVANRRYWDARRGPRLGEVVFRNDLSPGRALELVCEEEGEVDLVAEVPPAEAARVRRSEHASLVSIGALRVVAGVIDRDSARHPLADRRARQALKLAVDRAALVPGAVGAGTAPERDRSRPARG